MMVAGVITVSIGLSALIYFYAAGQTETRSMGANPLMEATIAAIASLFFSIAVCYGLLLIIKWNKAYVSVWVFENADKVDAWRTTGVLKCYLPRLGFIDAREGDFFSGPSRMSGPEHGMVHLELPYGQRIVDMQHIKECYGLQASHSTFTEVPARETYDLLERTVEAGNLKRGMNRSKMAKFMADNWVWIIMVVEGIMIFLMVQPQTPQ